MMKRRMPWFLLLTALFAVGCLDKGHDYGSDDDDDGDHDDDDDVDDCWSYEE